jgi:hypothetical protein
MIFGALSNIIVYNVEPSSDCSILSNIVIQEFIANVDSITQVSFFCGRKVVRGKYKIIIKNIDNSPLTGNPIAYSDSAGLFEYTLVITRFQPKIPMTKGFPYILLIENTSDLNTPLEILCNNRNPYLSGRLQGIENINFDIAGSITGTNNVPVDFFGMNSCMTVTAHEQPNLFRYQNQWKDCVDSMHIMDITWDRPGHCAWQHFQFDTLDNSNLRDTTYKWDWCDSLMGYYAADSINVLWLFTQSTKWASCNITDSAGWYDGMPKNLFEPVLDKKGNINPKNYFARYVYKFVKRYGPDGEFWRNKTNVNPVIFYEMWNEPEWALQNYWREDSMSFITDSVYRRLINSLGSKKSFMSVYSRLCIVGDSAAKIASSYVKTIIYVPYHYWERKPLVDTNEWLSFLNTSKLYNHCDGLSFHTYALDSIITPMPPPYYHNRQKLNLDSIWILIKKYDNFKNKFLWCTEFGTGFFSTTYSDPASNNLFEKQAQLLIKTMVSFYANDIPQGPLSHGFLWAYSTRYYPDIWENKRVAITGDSFYCRPTGFAYRQFLKIIRNCRYTGMVNTLQTDPSYRIYSFENCSTGKHLYIGWKEKSSTNITTSFRIPVQTDAAWLYRLTSSAQENLVKLIADRNGWISVDFSDTPTYIIEPGILQPSRPDLIIDTVWSEPAITRTGGTIQITSIIRNIGNSNSPKNIEYNIYLDGKNIYADKIKAPIKPKGKILIKSKPIKCPEPGNRIYKISVNTPAEFVELDFLNNNKFHHISVAP